MSDYAAKLRAHADLVEQVGDSMTARTEREVADHLDTLETQAESDRKDNLALVEVLRQRTAQREEAEAEVVRLTAEVKKWSPAYSPDLKRQSLAVWDAKQDADFWLRQAAHMAAENRELTEANIRLGVEIAELKAERALAQQLAVEERAGYEDTIARLTREREEALRDRDGVRFELDGLEIVRRKDNEYLLKREKTFKDCAAQLAAALRQVEWTDTKFGKVFAYCPWCKRRYDSYRPEHTPDCPRQLALAAYEKGQKA